jgi:hypothetical protein
MFVVMGWQQWAASTCQQIKTRDERAAAHLARRQVIRLFLPFGWRTRIAPRPRRWSWNRRLSFSLNRMFSANRRMPPPSQLEVFLFWVVGIVITILSGGVAIYASHLHLWDR